MQVDRDAYDTSAKSPAAVDAPVLSMNRLTVLEVDDDTADTVLNPAAVEYELTGVPAVKYGPIDAVPVDDLV
jgi:hypothetical protein